MSLKRRTLGMTTSGVGRSDGSDGGDGSDGSDRSGVESADPTPPLYRGLRCLDRLVTSLGFFSTSTTVGQIVHAAARDTSRSLVTTDPTFARVLPTVSYASRHLMQ